MARKRYTNLDELMTVRSFADIRKWRKERAAKRKDLSWQVPQAKQVDLRNVPHGADDGVITWIGHSTFCIRYAGLTIVTDPVWAQTMGFTKRLAPPGVPLDEMPPVDVVLLSHSHYDHLNFPSIRRLKGDPLILVPAGLRQKFVRKGFARVEEREWWEGRRVNGVEFVFVPAQHWTKRTLWDTNTSHWGGWIVRQTAGQVDDNAGTSSESRAELPVVYFAGDSGYFRGFRESGERFAPEIVLMPIGAYEPEWFMSPQHVSPEEAVQAFADTGGRLMIPMHYGTFRLADDTPKEAVDRLLAEWSRRGLPEERLCRLEHGGSVRISKQTPVMTRR